VIVTLLVGVFGFLREYRTMLGAALSAGVTPVEVISSRSAGTRCA